MKFHDIEQNTDEWIDLRIGKLTGSSIPKVMANDGKAFGDPAKALAATIAREQITGKRSINNQYSNSHMDRGHKQEPIARKHYEDMFFVDVDNGGFFDCGNTGCSPDGLVLSDGVIEIKSVIDNVQYSNIKRGGLDPAYKWQCIFNLNKTGRDWLDFVTYCADFPEKTRLYVFRIHKVDFGSEFAAMNNRVSEFFSLVERMKIVIRG